MRWLLLLLVIAVAAAGASLYFFPPPEPIRYNTNDVYLTRYASVTTPGGVYGFPPGTKLTLEPTRRASPGTVAVTDGTHELEIEADALTRNPAIARKLAEADQRGQTQAVAGVAAEKARVAKAEADAQLARARDIDRINARMHGIVLPPAPKPTPTPSAPPRLVLPPRP